LEERVEKLDYGRDEKLQRVDKAEKEKAALTEPVKKAKDYLRDQNSKTRYQNMLTQKQIYQAKLKVTEKEAQRIELLEKMKTLQTRLDEILRINQERLQELHQAEKEFKTAEREYNKVKKKFDAADAEFIQLGQELQRTNETRKKLQKEKN
jgi:chromosome segregation ATPase